MLRLSLIICFVLIIAPQTWSQSEYMSADTGFDVEQFREENAIKMKEHKPIMSDHGKGCAYLCKNGAVPTPKKFYRPKYNGCGIPGNIKGMSWDDSNFQFRGCCDDHDMCYGTCNKPKPKCDKTFERCLLGWCDRHWKGKDAELYQNCTSRAQKIHGLTKLMACGMYHDAQEEACDCFKSKVAGEIEKEDNDEL